MTDEQRARYTPVPPRDEFAARQLVIEFQEHRSPERSWRDIAAEFAKVRAEERRDIQWVLSKVHDTEHCDVSECGVCAIALCPWAEPLHTHHDGCPSCVTMGERGEHGEDDR